MSYPVRVIGWTLSCCKQPTLLVLGMEGGYVTANCSKPGCNNKTTIAKVEFKDRSLWVSLPGARMIVAVMERNCAYICSGCSIYVRLADLLPYWIDLERRWGAPRPSSV